MSRSIWKGYFIKSFGCVKSKSNQKFKGVLKIWSRNSSICQKFLNRRVSIHNGRDFRYLLITRDHLGFKFGQFMFTRNFNRAQKAFKK